MWQIRRIGLVVTAELLFGIPRNQRVQGCAKNVGQLVENTPKKLSQKYLAKTIIYGKAKTLATMRNIIGFIRHLGSLIGVRSAEQLQLKGLNGLIYQANTREKLATGLDYVHLVITHLMEQLRISRPKYY